MRDQHERPRHEEGTAGSHAVLYTVRVQDAAASRRPMGALVAVGGLLLVVVALGAWFRWNVESPPSEPAWAVRTAPPASPSPPAVATPAASPTLGPLALGTPRRLLALAEPGVMATSDAAAFVGGFSADAALPSSPMRCGTPSFWRIADAARPVPWGVDLGSITALGAIPDGRIVAIGRAQDCQAARLVVGRVEANSASWTSSDSAPPLSLLANAAWVATSPASTSAEADIAGWAPGPGIGTTFRTQDGGASWQELAGTRPLGWDPIGRLWTVTSDGVTATLGRSGSGAAGIDMPDAATAASVAEVGVVFRGSALVNNGREVLRVALDGGDLETAIVLSDTRFAANSRAVAIAGGGGESLTPTVVISLDGIHFVRRILPSTMAATISNILSVALAPDAVLVETADSTGEAIVWAIPVSGVPPIPVPSPSPQPTPEPEEPFPLPPAPSYPPAVVTSTWTRVDVTPSATGGGLLAGSGWNVFAVGAGRRGFLGFDSLAADRTVHVLRSGDGTSWATVADLPDSVGAHIAGLAHDGDQYVAVGQQCNPGCEPAAWRSSDLATWSKAVVKGGSATMTCVTAGRHGFVAGGVSADVGVPLWTSRDGSTWTRTGSWESFPGQTEILSVAETARGYILHGRLDGRTTAWTSGDGLTWHRVDLELEGTLVAVIHGSRGFLALGRRTDGREATVGADAPAVAWTSDDGLNWVHRDAPALAASIVFAAAEGPGGYVAVGFRRSAASMESAMWTSRDGLAWSAVAGVDFHSAGVFTNAASDGRHLVVAMETGVSATQLRPTVWVSDGVVR